MQMMQISLSHFVKFGSKMNDKNFVYPGLSDGLFVQLLNDSMC